MGRNKEKFEAVCISLPIEVIARVRLLLFDPVSKRTRYGALSNLITNLLRDWISRMEREHRQ